MTETKALTASGLLEQNMERISKIASGNIRPERLAGIALSLYNGDPKLKQCSQVSLVRAVAACAAAGVEPNVGANAMCYFIPYGNQIQFQLSYMGLIQVLLRSESIISIHASVVYEGDEFQWREGSFQSIDHKPGPNWGKNDKMIYAYAVGTLKSGQTQHVVLSPEQIERRRSASKQKNSDLWTKWVETAWKKCAIKELSKYLPVTYDAAQGIAADEADDMGLRHAFYDGEDGEVFESATDALAAKLGKKAKPEPIDVTPEKGGE